MFNQIECMKTVITTERVSTLIYEKLNQDLSQVLHLDCNILCQRYCFSVLVVESVNSVTGSKMMWTVVLGAVLSRKSKNDLMSVKYLKANLVIVIILD